MLERFDIESLQRQMSGLLQLEDSMEGKKDKFRRRTLRRQREKITSHISALSLQGNSGATSTCLDTPPMNIIQNSDNCPDQNIKRLENEKYYDDNNPVNKGTTSTTPLLLENPKNHLGGKGFFWQS